MTFGEKISKLRKECGLSQEELSSQLNVSRQAISKWENDSGYPETEKIIRMGTIFGVTLDYLLNDELNEEAKKDLNGEQGYYVSREMAAGFLLYQQIKIRKIALASGVLVAGLSLAFTTIEISMLLFMAVLIISISIVVSVKFSDNPYKKLWTEPLCIDPAVGKELQTSYIEMKKKANIELILGTVLLAGGFLFAPLLLASLPENWSERVMQVAMFLAGIGVYLCVYNSGLVRSHRILAMKDPSNKIGNKRK